MMKHAYTGEFPITDDHRAEKITVTLTGKLTSVKCPALDLEVQLENLEKWQNNLLPFG